MLVVIWLSRFLHRQPPSTGPALAVQLSGVGSRPSRICLLVVGQLAIPKGKTRSLAEDIDSASDVCLARRDLQSRDLLT